MSSILSQEPASPRGWLPFSSKEETRKRSPSMKKSRGFKVIATAMGLKSKKSSLILEPQDEPPHQSFACAASQPDKSMYRSSQTTKNSMRNDVDLSGKPSGSREFDFFTSGNLSSSTLHSQRAKPPMDRRVSYGSSTSRSNVRAHDAVTDLPDVLSGGFGYRDSTESLQSVKRTNRGFRAGPPNPLKMLPEDSPAGQESSSRSSNRSWLRNIPEREANRPPRLLSDTIPTSSPLTSRDFVHRSTIARVGSPPCAPPKQKLPRPPLLARSDESIGDFRKGISGSSSPASSFLSCPSLFKDTAAHEVFAVSKVENSKSSRLAKCEEMIRHMSPDSPPQSNASTPLKKALSQQSLRKHTISPSIPIFISSTSSTEPRSRTTMRRSDNSTPSSSTSPILGSATVAEFSSPYLVNEYTPKQILSPEEMEQLQSSAEDSHLQLEQQHRLGSLGLSIPTSTDDVTDEGGYPGGYSESQRRWESSTLSSVFSGKLKTFSAERFTMPSKPTSRPSTSPTTMKTYSPESSISHVLFLPVTTSLPPPPRRQTNRPIFVDFPSTDCQDRSVPSRPLVPVHPKTSVNAMDRPLIIRKPSFLDIGDDSDEGDVHEIVEEQLEDSFLDLTRDSSL